MHWQLLKNWKSIERKCMRIEVGSNPCNAQSNLTRQPISIDDKTASVFFPAFKSTDSCYFFLLGDVLPHLVMFFHQNNRKYLRALILNCLTWHKKWMISNRFVWWHGFIFRAIFFIPSTFVDVSVFSIWICMVKCWDYRICISFTNSYTIVKSSKWNELELFGFRLHFKYIDIVYK